MAIAPLPHVAPLDPHPYRKYFVWGAVSIAVMLFGALLWYMEQQKAAENAANAQQEASLVNSLMSQSSYDSSLSDTDGGYGSGSGGLLAGEGYVTSPTVTTASSAGTGTTSLTNNTSGSSLASQIASLEKQLSSAGTNQQKAIASAVAKYTSASAGLNSEISSLTGQVGQLNSDNQANWNVAQGYETAYQNLENAVNQMLAPHAGESAAQSISNYSGAVKAAEGYT